MRRTEAWCRFPLPLRCLSRWRTWTIMPRWPLNPSTTRTSWKTRPETCPWSVSKRKILMSPPQIAVSHIASPQGILRTSLLLIPTQVKKTKTSRCCLFVYFSRTYTFITYSFQSQAQRPCEYLHGITSAIDKLSHTRCNPHHVRIFFLVKSQHACRALIPWHAGCWLLQRASLSLKWVMGAYVCSYSLWIN